MVYGWRVSGWKVFVWKVCVISNKSFCVKSGWKVYGWKVCARRVSGWRVSGWKILGNIGIDGMLAFVPPFSGSIFSSYFFLVLFVPNAVLCIISTGSQAEVSRKEGFRRSNERVVLVCQGLLLFMVMAMGSIFGIAHFWRWTSHFFRLYSGRFATKTARTDMECWVEPGRPMLAKIFTYYMMGLPSGFAPTFTCGVGWGSSVRCHVVCTQTYIQMEHGTQRVCHVGTWYATCLSCGVVGHVNVQCHVAWTT